MEKQIIIYRSLPYQKIIQKNNNNYLFFNISDNSSDKSGIYIPNDEELYFEERKTIARDTFNWLHNNIDALRYVNIGISRLITETELSVLKVVSEIYNNKKFNITLCFDTSISIKDKEEGLNILISNGVCIGDVLLAGIVPCIKNMQKIIAFSSDGIKTIYSGFFDSNINKEILAEEQFFVIKYLIKLGFVKNILLSAQTRQAEPNFLIKKHKNLVSELLRLGVKEEDLVELFHQNPEENYF